MSPARQAVVPEAGPDQDDREFTRYRRDQFGVVFQFYNLVPSLNAALWRISFNLRSGEHHGLTRRSLAFRSRISITRKASCWESPDSSRFWRSQAIGASFRIISTPAAVNEIRVIRLSVGCPFR